MSDYHCLHCFAEMIDTCPCRCCGPTWECPECAGCSPCYADECRQCVEEAQADEALADSSLASPLR